MLPEIKLVISQNCKIIKAVTKQVDTHNFVKTIEHFQEVANATLTEMIDDLGGSGDGIVADDGESDPDEDVCTSPKRKKR